MTPFSCALSLCMARANGHLPHMCMCMRAPAGRRRCVREASWRVQLRARWPRTKRASKRHAVAVRNSPPAVDVHTQQQQQQQEAQRETPLLLERARNERCHRLHTSDCHAHADSSDALCASAPWKKEALGDVALDRRATPLVSQSRLHSHAHTLGHLRIDCEHATAATRRRYDDCTRSANDGSTSAIAS